MQQVARVVVIGGGIVGCAVLYHLARAGWRDLVLLERQELTSGSSWHAAGSLFTLTQPNLAAQMQLYSFRSYRDIERESGQPVGFHLTGGISICRSEDEVLAHTRLQSACRRLGIESHFLPPEEAASRCPILDARRMTAALWEEEGGHVDPASATQAFAAAARKLGAVIERQTPVTATRPRADGSWDVETPHGTIHAEHVVNAAGLWAREVGRLAGVELPLMPVEHHYLVTETIPEIAALGFELPQINDNEIGCYARQEGRGLLFGAYEGRCTPWSREGTPADFGHELLPDDLSRMDWNFEQAVGMMPCLATAGVKRAINGPMMFSPDLAPLLGPHPALRNYFCANGVMTGFNQGPGVGKILADWITEGDPGVDALSWDVARFGDWAPGAFTEARVRYFYEHRCERGYPLQEVDAGRPVRPMPIQDRLHEAGAVFGFSFGNEHANWFAPRPGQRDTLTYRQPNWWQPVADEGRRIREAAGLMEYTALSKFEVRGSGAAAWLDRILAGRLPAIGRLTLNPMLTEGGRIAGDLSAARLGPDRFVLLGSDAMQLAFLRRFRRDLPATGVEIVNRSVDLAGLHLCGPLSRDVLTEVTEGDLDSARFPFLSAAEMTVAGVPDVIVLRVSFTGERGYELYMPRDRQARVFDALLAAGRGRGLALVGSRSLMMTRLEKSFPAWGLELSADYTPQEAGLMRHVAVDKGDFVGRAALSAGPVLRERIATFTVDAGADAVWGGEAIFLEGEPVGYVTSGGWGPAVGQHIAMGYVLPDAWHHDAPYTVEVLGRHRAAALQPRPLYDPEGKRMRA
ncbi:FAD-dependent oxidoreductase [Defluviimonas sp. WL0002]|uniref:FAD-dependent oxidoreductase n=1 Tax=Albidovulum marisflavi TaxID=2984159 RepID=A0ABT2Z997_9RHOB|nr:FAD-dependent oxidoreductase [Defluviimonas sp. WL0002]MCV2867703.1 FAD-dependent oxidoreductase [Defluviimonas sp. WL0002]